MFNTYNFRGMQVKSEGQEEQEKLDMSIAAQIPFRYMWGRECWLDIFENMSSEVEC